MSFEVKGQIKAILPIQTGTSKDGSEWKKLTFVVSNEQGYEGREQTYALEIFGADRVDNFMKFNKEGNEVLVKFDIRTNKHQGKYYTNLAAFRVEGGDKAAQATPVQEATPVGELNDDLPF